ncbi:hypothetical protein C8R46DRAFT_1140118 [Mycena filopes]|nr:hypothetical protein C8R46DRAFT_1140118 [Mycena filopes]
MDVPNPTPSKSPTKNGGYQSKRGIWVINSLARLTVWCGPPMEDVDVRWDAKYVSFVEPKEPYHDKVLVLETNESPGNNQPIGFKYPAYFKQGSSALGEGDIVIKFDSTSSAWADSSYELFVEWLKTNTDTREKCRGLVADSRWETATRMAHLVEARISRGTQRMSK